MPKNEFDNALSIITVRDSDMLNAPATIIAIAIIIIRLLPGRARVA
jgi:hypothetical protein